METIEIIEECVDYAVDEFFGQIEYFDVTIGDFKEALSQGVITIDEIADRFKARLLNGL